MTDGGDDTAGDVHPPVTVGLPANPAPNTTIFGHFHTGSSQENFIYVFNEQVTNVDGSLTVYAAHEYIQGPTAVGDLYIGKSECGATVVPGTDPPAVTSVSPASGPLAGGQTVTITGTGFTGATAVKFSSTPATSFTVDSPTQITATSPARTAGTVNVYVKTPAGTSDPVTADRYTYATVPTVSSVSPASGPVPGGQTVTITGTGFTGASAVKFSSTPATSFTVVSSTKITAKTPARSAGTVNVYVTTAGGRSAPVTSSRYRYAAVPTVSSVSPPSGPVGGGQTVTITGTGFTGASAVKFSSTPATSFSVVSSTQITATSPAHTAGAVNIHVTTPGGNTPSTAATRYTYVGVPG